MNKNKEEVGNKLVELRRVLERIEQGLTRMMGRSTREWMSAYYNATGGIPNCFTAEQWRESEKIIYDSLVQEVNGDFEARNMFHSGMRVKLLEVLKKEREKMLKAKGK